MNPERVVRQVPPAHGGRPSPAESEQISARILDAAQRLFLRDGFSQTSMDTVAAEVGISKRTLYARHVSKAALFEAMVVEFIRRNAANLTAGDLSALPLRDRLLAVSERILAVATDPLFLALERVVTGEAQTFPQLAELVYQQGGLLLQNEIAAILRCNVANEAEIAGDAAIFLAIAILPPLRRAVLQRTTPGLAGVDRTFLERTVDIFLHGIEGRT